MTSIAVGACNLVTGAADLDLADPNAPASIGAGGRDSAADRGDVSPGSDGSVLTEGGGGGGGDAAADGGACTSLGATSLLGVASQIATTAFYQLTPENNALAGGIASASTVVLDDFDVSFLYSITYTAAVSAVGAGLAFFAIAAPAKDLACTQGPYLCTLGASAPGFAVILRTSKFNAGDPDPPYVAVVDAQTYPTTLPASLVKLDASKAYSLGSGGSGLPSAASFHQMTIAVRSGKVTASIDGAIILSSVPIPNWAAGRVSTWGIGASTGNAGNFAERNVVGQISFNRCP